MRLSDGPAINDQLDQRFGRRHDLGLQLRDFEVVFSVRVPEPGHINIEEGRALIHFVTIRSSSALALVLQSGA